MVSAVQNLVFDSLQSIRAREMGGARGENEKLRPATPPSSYTHTLLIPPCKKKGGGGGSFPADFFSVLLTSVQVNRLVF